MLNVNYMKYMKIFLMLGYDPCRLNQNNLTLRYHPCRFIRRGRAATAEDPTFDLASDVEDEELASWLDKPGSSMAWQLLQGKDTKQMCKFLPPGNVQELYQHYVASRQIMGSSMVSYPS